MRKVKTKMPPFDNAAQKSAQGHKEILEDIPTDALSKVIADYQSEGATVKTQAQQDGAWTLIAEFDQ